MTDRPTFTNLVDYVEGRLAPEAASTVERNLTTGDVETRSALTWIRTFHEVADRLPLETPPTRVRYYLRRQFEAAASRPPPLARVRRQLRAVLTFDSRAESSLVGVRSAGTDATATSLAFSSEAGDVIVDLSSAGSGRVRLDGQVLWAEGQSARLLEVRLSGPGFAEDAQGADDLGRFEFARVPAHVDRLVLHTEDADINLVWEPDETP